MKYVQVNCLRASLETAAYEYLIRLMDEYGYQDRKMVEVYYVPHYLSELIDADKEYFTKLIMSKVIRAKKYEVKDFLRKYLWDTYIKPIPTEIANTLSNMDALDVYDEIVKADEIEASYGPEYKDEKERIAALMKQQRGPQKNDFDTFKANTATTKEKGNYGEYKSVQNLINNQILKDAGYDLKPIGRPAPTSLKDKIVKGIDGIYENQNPNSQIK